MMRFFNLVIAFLLLFVGSAYTFDQKGLVVYLPFDDGNGRTAKDASGNKNDGDLVGTVDWVDGKHKKAVKISDNNANNMVVVKANPSLNITDQITFGAWVNIEAMPDSHCSLMTKADTYMIHTSNWSGKGIEQEPLIWPFDAWQTPASTPIQLNEWRHVMGVYDGKEIKTYIDGQLKGQRAYAQKIAITGNDFVIGRDSRACCATRKARITMDDVMLFSRALSENEVKEVMNANFMTVKLQEKLAYLWGQVKAE